MLLKHGIEPVYLPVLKVEELGVDVASFVRQIEGFHVFIFMTGQSAFSLANLAKSAGVYDQLRERLRAMEVYCRGSKAASNVKTHFDVECKATYETSDELLPGRGPQDGREESCRLLLRGCGHRVPGGAEENRG
jgi:uroporphyrinogen-III synthase